MGRNALLLVVILFANNLLSYGQAKSKTIRPVFSETTWTTTGRTLFLPGEEISFTAKVLETDTYKVSVLSKILKAELVNSEGLAVDQAEYYLEDGKARGVLKTPESAPSGWYYLRTYTNYMRNSSKALSNYVAIKLVDPHTLPESIESTYKSTISAILHAENNVLIGNVENVCAIKVNGLVNNVVSDGFLLGENGDTLSSFALGESGWGVLSFVPGGEQDYTISLKDMDTGLIKVTVPGYSDNAMHASASIGNSYVSINIQNYNGDDLSLLVHRYNSLYYNKAVNIRNKSASVSVPLRSLPNGLIQFTLLDNNNNILYKRLISNNPVGDNISIKTKGAEQEKPDYLIQLESDSYLEFENGLQNNIVSINEPGRDNSQLIPGLPGWHFSYDIPARPYELLAWTIANSYTDETIMSFFNSEGLLEINMDIESSNLERLQMLDYLPETRGYTFSGRIVDSSGAGMMMVNISATILSNNTFYSTPTFQDGRFFMVFDKHLSQEDVIVSYTQKPGESWELIIDKRYDERSFIPGPRAFSVSSEEIKYLKNLEVNRQLQSIYQFPIVADTIEEQIFSGQLDFIRNQGDVLKIDDYVKLSNIREVIYEVVPSISSRKTGDNYRLLISGDPPIPDWINPLFLLDGIPITEFNEFLNLPPDRLDHIRHINKVFIHGNSLYGGIASFQTVNNDLAGISLPEESLILTLNLPGYSLQEIKDPDDPFIPDLSFILMDKSFTNLGTDNIRFRGNDNFGEYLIRINGFNRAGQWIDSEKIVTLGSDGLINDNLK